MEYGKTFHYFHSPIIWLMKIWTCTLVNYLGIFHSDSCNISTNQCSLQCRHCWYTGYSGIWCLRVQEQRTHEHLQIYHEVQGLGSRSYCVCNDRRCHSQQQIANNLFIFFIIKPVTFTLIMSLFIYFSVCVWLSVFTLYLSVAMCPKHSTSANINATDLVPLKIRSIQPWLAFIYTYCEGSFMTSTGEREGGARKPSVSNPWSHEVTLDQPLGHGFK